MAPSARKTGWSPERRARHSALIRAKKPWLRSTGPRTAAGKAVSCMNARKHGLRGAEMRSLSRYLRECRAFILLAQMHLHSLEQETPLPPPGAGRDSCRTSGNRGWAQINTDDPCPSASIRGQAAGKA